MAYNLLVKYVEQKIGQVNVVYINFLRSWRIQLVAAGVLFFILYNFIYFFRIIYPFGVFNEQLYGSRNQLT